jgi:hypothetical protein
MNSRLRHRHVMDLLFPLALFFVFAASALVVLVLSADLYDQITQDADDHFTQRTASAYVLEKVRQNDEAGGIGLEIRDGVPCLALTRTAGSITTITYIYAQDGVLRQMRTRPGTEFSLSDGTEIAAVEDLSLTALSDTLYRLTITCPGQEAVTLLLGERSQP